MLSPTVNHQSLSQSTDCMFCVFHAPGSSLTRLTQVLATAAATAPTLGNITHLELRCLHRPKNITRANQLVEDLANIVSTFSSLCPRLTHLTQRTLYQSPKDLGSPRMRVAHLLNSLGPGLIAQLTHLRIYSELWEFRKREFLLTPLSPLSVQSIGRCTSLTHFEMMTHAGQHMFWESLPTSLQYLKVHTVSLGSTLHAHLPSLRIATIHSDCAAGDLVPLLQSAPAIKHVCLRDVTAAVSFGGLQQMRSLQASLNAARFSMHDSTGGYSDTAAEASLGSASGSSSSSSSGVTASIGQGLLPVVHMRGVQLLILPDNAGIPVASFLNGMPSMPDVQVLFLAKHVPAQLLPALPNPEPFLLHVAGVFPSLRTLSLLRCRLSNADLLTLLNCPQLAALHLCGCDGLSRAGVVQLARVAENLLVLAVHGCPGVRMMGRREVAAILRPRLTGPRIGERVALLQMQDSLLFQWGCRRRFDNKLINGLTLLALLRVCVHVGRVVVRKFR